MKRVPSVLVQLNNHSFPPHSCGGLIEATEVCEMEYHFDAVFPRIRAGASLKLRVHEGRVRRHHGFPPHSCGGLIEATV